MFFNSKIKKGFSLIEAMIVTTISLALIAVFFKFITDYQLRSSQKSFASDISLILKSVDMRVAIDGYSYVYWPETNENFSNEDSFEFIQKAFISKNNKTCGRADGWIPTVESESERIFVDCNMWKERIPFDAQINISTSRVDFGLIGDLALFINFPNNHDKFKTMSTILNHLTKMNITAKMGMFNFDYYNIENQNATSKMECLKDIENCVLRASWSKRGLTENIKIDGTNSMINSNLAFKLEKKDEENIKTCLLWDEEQDGLWESRQVECGVGVYSKNKNEVPVLVQMPVNNVNSNRILLTKECDQYGVSSINGQIEKLSEKVPCGIIEDSNQIVMYVDRFSAKEMTVSDTLYSNMIQNVEYINIANDLINNYSESVANLNILNVSNDTIFNNVVEFIDEVVIGDPELTPKPIEVYLTVDHLETFNLKVREDAEVMNLTVSNNIEDGNKNENLIIEPKENGEEYSNYLKSTYFLSTSDSKVNDECFDLNSMIIQKGSGILLTCREAQNNNGKYTWQSNYYGEIGIFDNEECPYGWSEIKDLNSRIMMGSGNFNGEAFVSGDKGGEAFVSLTEEELPEHNHMTSRLEHLCEDGCSINVDTNKLVTHAGQSYISKDSGIYSTNVGGNKGHNNLPNYISVKYCVYGEGDNKTPDLDDLDDLDPIWESHQPLISGWIDDAITKFYQCKNERYEYSPIEGVYYTLADCKLNQYRIVKEREREKYSGEIRFTGNEYTEYRTINETQIWEETTTVYSEWYDIREPYNCTEEVVIKEDGIYYKEKDCKQDQEREKQRMEKDIRFGDERELGEITYEYQTIDVNLKRKIAAAYFDVDYSDLRVNEGDSGETYKLPIKIRLEYPFEEEVKYRVQTQDISTDSYLYKTQNLIYDEFGNPFISIVDNENGGKLMYDAGFPKYYNGFYNSSQDRYKNGMKFLKNIIEWISESKKEKGKVLVIGDRNAGPYIVNDYNSSSSGFGYTFTNIIKSLGYQPVITSYPFNKINLDLSLEYLENFSSVIIMSSSSERFSLSLSGLFSESTINSFPTYVNNGGGLLVITDHNVFQKTGNQVLRKFGSEFYDNIDRNENNDAYKLTTILDKLKNTNYGEGFVLWKDLSRNSFIRAGGSEGNVRLYEQPVDLEAFTSNITFSPNQVEQTIYITINGDDLLEYDEQFKIMLDNIDGNGIVTGSDEITVTIIDDDSAIKSTTILCPNNTILKDDICVGQKKIPLERSEKVIEETTESYKGFAKIRYKEDGLMKIKADVNNMLFDLTCNEFELKPNENTLIINNNNLDGKNEIYIDNISILNIEAWNSFYTFKNDYKPKSRNCLNLTAGYDANIEIKADFIKRIIKKEPLCLSGSNIDNECVLNIIEIPQELCLGSNYIKKSDRCIKK